LSSGIWFNGVPLLEHGIQANFVVQQYLSPSVSRGCNEFWLHRLRPYLRRLAAIVAKVAESQPGKRPI
jgi:hypothetical protein